DRLKNAIGERLPLQVGLPPDEKEQIACCVGEEDVERHVVLDDHAVFILHVRPKQGRDLHRTGEVVDVKIVRRDGSDALNVPAAHELLDGAGGDVPAVHPTGRSGQESRTGELGGTGHDEVTGGHGGSYARWGAASLK